MSRLPAKTRVSGSSGRDVRGASAFRALPNFGGRFGEASLPRFAPAHVSLKYGHNPVPLIAPAKAGEK